MFFAPQIGELIREASRRAERPTPSSLLNLIGREVEPRLSHCRFSAESYQRHPIFLGDDWEVMLIAWDSGQKTPIHDHRGVLGAMSVFSGSLIEERFETPQGRPELLERAARPSGDHSETSPTLLHRLFPARGKTISLHIYRPPLREMGIWQADGLTEIRPSQYDVEAAVLAGDAP